MPRKSQHAFLLFLFHCHAQPFDALGQVLQFLFHAYQEVPGNDHGEPVLGSLAGQQGQVIHGQAPVLSSLAPSESRSLTSVTLAPWMVSTGRLFLVRKTLLSTTLFITGSTVSRSTSVRGLGIRMFFVAFSLSLKIRSSFLESAIVPYLLYATSFRAWRSTTYMPLGASCIRLPNSLPTSASFSGVASLASFS